ncbi:MAG: type I 3-dehydroquinate dehydratase [Chlamydiia bacterium]|nr:type I 3-dehydroquinate dehydratase [Chlamydiia bacterium]
MICVVITGSSKEEAQKQIDHALPYADLFEFRGDVVEVPLPTLVTVGEETYGFASFTACHNFEKTPHNLGDFNSYGKVAFNAKSSSDALRLLLHRKKTGAPKIALSMGEEGQFTRILAPVVGVPWTYAAPYKGAENAPGQLTAQELVEVYRYRSLSPSTRVFGLIGDPVEQSIGHLTHNGYYREENLDAVYIKMRVAKEELSEFIPLAKEFGFAGLSVTMPLKEAVIPFLDELDVEAEKIGAVNTIVVKEGRWLGFNTDCIGALHAAKKRMSIREKNLAIVGAGGAAKALIHAFKSEGARIDLFVRGTLQNLDKKNYDAVVNCTPCTLSVSEEKLWDIRIGAPFGLDMFHAQARAQHELWFR